MPNLTFAALSGAFVIIFLVLAYIHYVVFGDMRETMNAAARELVERSETSSATMDRGKDVNLTARSSQKTLHYGYFTFVAAAVIAAMQMAAFALEYLGIHVLP